ncbi:MAG: DUF3419 family protein [Fibrella sp.]|nr:DUF3419 family protein [Armatimonadota bacterium]
MSVPKTTVPLKVSSEVASRADFSAIRYAQCWEDADILLAGLDIQPGDTCLAICSAGDNALAMLARGPARVVALDLSAAQIACAHLRVAAYRTLGHGELLALVGSTSASAPERASLYQRCRPLLNDDTRAFWDDHAAEIGAGIGSAGKFERYFTLFRTQVLPWVHGRRMVDRLRQGGTLDERMQFYKREWNTLRWQLLFRVFFSRFVMGRLGRDPAFFQYVEGSIADRILARTRHALTYGDPASNPYLQWILTGTHTPIALPFALRPENFEAIRANLDALDLRLGSVESFLEESGEASIDRFNLSDIFEYMSPPNFETLLRRLARSARPGARLAYWNMLAPRRRPASMADLLKPVEPLATELFQADKAFFYSAFVVEERLA